MPKVKRVVGQYKNYPNKNMEAQHKNILRKIIKAYQDSNKYHIVKNNVGIWQIEIIK